MCAIAGILDLPATEPVVSAMLTTMARRGPDGEGIYAGEGCTLLHSRLAIIDPTGGSQPMTLEWAGERYILVYNGELYNTEALRRELSALGHEFSGHSDTEVVLHGYAQWGEACVERFNGIFAMAVWEQQRRRLFLSRDRIGVKPLFFMLHQGGLIFGSEIKTILAYPTVRPELDGDGAAQIVLLGPGRIPGSGVFRGIKELEPGCRGYFENGKFHWQRYWKLRDREHTESFEQTLEVVRELVTDAIRRQMVSDVPIGCFLSGGLDSSIICAVCAKEKQGIDTFSVDYQDNEQYFVAGKFQPDADTAYIHLMQEAIGSRHHWTVLKPEDLAANLERATLARDLPGMADVDFSLLAFCQDIRKEVKVALSGECADEIFGGYPWYRDPEVRNTDGFPWSQNMAQRICLMHPEIRIRVDGREFVQAQYDRTLQESDILPGTSPLEKRMKEMVNLNFRWFMQTLLDRKDRMSMYHGLEVRVPFCDYRVAEYLYGVPWEYKDYRGREKGLLRHAMEGILPEKILRRKKSPYPKTHHPVYMDIMRRGVQTLLERKDAAIFSIFDREEVRKLLEGTPKWPWYGQLMTLPQTFAYLLQVDFWLRHYKISLV
ncbi:MAG: asparagine synthase (glutamine-hydrolyzing) [Oscillospiraceae bacterium]|nr:asparagine synthase (glutamine-hydrolyzing) [Oscillospiraceae bacterium]